MTKKSQVILGLMILLLGAAWEWNIQRIEAWPTGATWILMAIGAMCVLWGVIRESS